MQYQFKVKGFTATGNPSVTFMCKHCHKLEGGRLTGYLYYANLRVSPRDNIQGACNEFIQRINSGDFDIFPKKRTAKKLKDEVCNCNASVIDIEHVRAVRRAQAILKAGLEQRNNRLD